MKAILLDLDGTLINSEKAFSRCFVDVLNNKYSCNVTLADYKKYELENNALLIDYCKKSGMISNNISDNDIMSIVYDRYEDYFREIIKEDETKSNFSLLRELKKDYLLGLITTCRRYYLDILDGEEKIYELFDIVIAREDVKALKPNPEAYLKALEVLGIDSSEAISLEDSKRGVDSSVLCGIAFAGTLCMKVGSSLRSSILSTQATSQLRNAAQISLGRYGVSP